MVSAITLGSFGQVNGKYVIFGAGGSGLDSLTYINGLAQAKGAAATPLQQEIAKNQKVVAALGEFQGLLSTFKSTVNTLRNPPGVGNEAENAFKYNSVSLTSNTTESASDYVSVTSAPGALKQTIKINEIVSLASTTKQSSNSFTIADADTTGLVLASGAGPGFFNAGTFTVAPGSTVTLTVDDTLNTIAAKFNLITSSTKINASVIEVDDGEFVLSFTGIVPGADDEFDLGDPGTVTSDASGVLSQITFNTTQDASDAEFDLDGITVTRSSNTISDLIDGVTISLIKKTPVTVPPADPFTVSATVEADTTTAKSNIVAMANAYNALKEFQANQTELDSDGTYADTAVLATNSLFRNTIDTILSHISSTVEGIVADNPKILSDVGITLTDSPATPSTPEIKNIMTIDETVLDSALASKFDAVADLFQFDFSSSSTKLAVFKRTNALAVNEFSVNVNPFASQVISGLNIADTNTTPIVVASGATASQFNAGPITVNGQTITLTAGMTLDQVANAFNTVVGTTGLAAAVTGSAGSYTLTFTATRQSGKVNLFDLTSTTQDAGNTVFGSVEITATGTFEATYDNGTGPITIDLDGTAISGGGGFLLKGQDGTVLEGLQMIFGSQAAEEADVSVTQGIGDKIWNTLDGVLTTNGGALKLEYESLQEKEADLQERIDKIDEIVEKFKIELIQKFSALESVISQVNGLLQALDANEKAKQQFAS